MNSIEPSKTIARILAKTTPLPAARLQTPTAAPLDLALIFDTTVSMYSYLARVRERLSDLASQVQARLSQVRFAVIAYSDYWDEDAYVTKVMNLTGDLAEVRRFIEQVEPTDGHDWPEAVEEALYEANRLSWTIGSRRVAVLVGDAPPHGIVDSRENCKLGHYYEDEVAGLASKSVRTYTVQCGDDVNTQIAFTRISHRTQGKTLSLTEIDDLIDLIVAICMKEFGLLEAYRADLKRLGRLSPSKQKLLLDLTGE